MDKEEEVEKSIFPNNIFNTIVVLKRDDKKLEEVVNDLFEENLMPLRVVTKDFLNFIPSTAMMDGIEIDFLVITTTYKEPFKA